MTGGARPFVDSAPNGVPVINIQTPNGAGLSHNVYTNFNVQNNGLIFNNGATNSQTQLGGYILGNSNLKSGQEAKTILNEVQGANQSSLRGFMEVAGKQANVIIANQNGITCNGCGFINTSRAVLTTGVPNFNSAGGLDHFDVTQGNILIEGLGLNANATNQLDLLARTAQINAAVVGQSINVVVGANRIDYATLNATAITGTGAQPTVALDVSALGGMYANAIKLVATEQGVGVRNAGTLASSGNMSLSSNGMVSLGGVTQAGGKLSIQAQTPKGSGPAVKIIGKVQSSSSVAISAQGDGIAISGQVLAATSLTFTTQGQLALTNTGILSSNGGDTQLNVDSFLNQGQVLSAGLLSISATGDITNQNAINAVNAISLASATLENTGFIAGVSAVSATITKSFDNSGTFAGSAVAITAGSLINEAGAVVASTASDIAIAAQTLTNMAQGQILSAGNLTVSATTLQNNGNLAANTNVNLYGTTVINTGQIAAVGQLIIAANNQLDFATLIDNSGQLISGGLMALYANSLTNEANATMVSLGGMSLNLASLQNNGQILAAKNLLIAKGSQAGVNDYLTSLTNTGAIYSAASLDIYAQGFLNASGALISASTNVNIFDNDTNNALNNQGVLFAGSNLTLAKDTSRKAILAGVNNNNGGQIGAGSLVAIAAASLSNDATSAMTSNVTLNLATDTLTNAGTILATGALTIGGSASLNNGVWGNGGVYANQGQGLIGTQNGNLTIYATTLSNDTQAKIKSGSKLNLSATASLTNNGLLSAVSDANLYSATFTNTGQILSGGAITAAHDNTLHAATSLTNAGTIWSSNGLQLAASTFNNNTGANIWNAGSAAAYILATNFANYGNIISSTNLTLAGGGNGTTGFTSITSFTNAGVIGEVGASGTLSLYAGQFSNASGAYLQSNGNIGIYLSGTNQIFNGGVIWANGLLTMAADANLNRTSDSLYNAGIISGSTNQLAINAITNNTNAYILATSGDLFLYIQSLDNAGILWAQNKLTLAGDVNLNAMVGGVSNHDGGILRANTGSLTIIANGDVNNNYALIAGGLNTYLWINGSLNNVNNAEVYAANDLAITAVDGSSRASTVLNSSALIVAQYGNLSINANNITNQKQSYGVGGASTIYDNNNCATARDVCFFITVIQWPVTADSPYGMILASGNVTISGGSLINNNSLIESDSSIFLNNASVQDFAPPVTLQITIENPGYACSDTSCTVTRNDCTGASCQVASRPCVINQGSCDNIQYTAGSSASQFAAEAQQAFNSAFGVLATYAQNQSIISGSNDYQLKSVTSQSVDTTIYQPPPTTGSGYPPGCEPIFISGSDGYYYPCSSDNHGDSQDHSNTSDASANGTDPPGYVNTLSYVSIPNSAFITQINANANIDTALNLEAKNLNPNLPNAPTALAALATPSVSATGAVNKSLNSLTNSNTTSAIAAKFTSATTALQNATALINTTRSAITAKLLAMTLPTIIDLAGTPQVVQIPIASGPFVGGYTTAPSDTSVYNNFLTVVAATQAGLITTLNNPGFQPYNNANNPNNNLTPPSAPPLDPANAGQYISPALANQFNAPIKLADNDTTNAQALLTSAYIALNNDGLIVSQDTLVADNDAKAVKTEPPKGSIVIASTGNVSLGSGVSGSNLYINSQGNVTLGAAINIDNNIAIAAAGALTLTNTGNGLVGLVDKGSIILQAGTLLTKSDALLPLPSSTTLSNPYALGGEQIDGFTLRSGGAVALAVNDNLNLMSADISGSMVAIQSGGNLTLAASNVSSQGALDLTAIGSIAVLSAQQTTTTTTTSQNPSQIAASGFGSYKNSLEATSTTTTTTQIGSTISGQDVTLHSGGNITVLSSTITGSNSATLFAGGGVTIASLANTSQSSEATTLRSSNPLASITPLGTTDGATTSTLASAKITGGNVNILANGGNLNTFAATLSAAGNLTLAAGGSINLSALQQAYTGTDRSAQYADALQCQGTSCATQALDPYGAAGNVGSGTYWIGTTATAGGALTLSAGQDITMDAATLSGNAVALSALGDILITSDVDTFSSRNSYTKSGFFSSKTITTTHESALQQGSSIAAGAGGLTLTAGGNATILSSTLASAGNLTSYVGGDEVISGNYDVVQNTYTKKNSGFLGISLLGGGTSSTATQINNFVGSSAQAGANLLLASGGSATLVGSSITAGGQAVLAYGVGPAAKAGASLNLDAAINSTLTQSSSTNNGLVVSTKVADTFTQSLTYNQFSPNIAFVGAGPINVDYQGALVNETQNSKAPQMPKGFGSWVGTQGIGTNGASGAACPAGVTCTTTSFSPAQIATALGAANDNLAYLTALNNNPAALVNTSAAIAQAQAALQQLGITLDTSTLTPGGNGINWNALTLTNQSATWETKSLNPIAMIVVNAILHMVMGPAADMLSAAMQAAVISAIDSGINGAISGKLDAGQALENAAIAALEAAAFSAVHVTKDDLGIPQTQNIFSPNFDPVAALESASLHALVGCGGGALSGAANGGSAGGGCASGAAAAGIGDLAGNIQTGSQLGQFLVTTLAGGIGSKLGGGDFATGAFQAGLGYFYNDALVLFNSKAALTFGQGHVAIAIGNDIVGWNYYSKDGLEAFTDGNQHAYFATLQELLAAYPSYTSTQLIPTSTSQDMLMLGYANDNYNNPYGFCSNNCADFVVKTLKAGSVQIPISITILGIRSPRLLFNGLNNLYD